MESIENGTVGMVLDKYIVDGIGFSAPYNIKGHLVYDFGKLPNCGTFAHVLHEDYNGLTACNPKKIAQIDPNNLEKSLSSAYRKSIFLGKFNLFLKIPLSELKKEYSRYESYFKENC